MSVPPVPAQDSPQAPSRRGFHRLLASLLTAAISLVVLIPGVGYLLTPILRRGGGGKTGFTPVARLRDLQPGVPRAFPVIESRQDAWVRYPDEPVGMVWLILRPDNAKEPVLALSAECPHLACAITLSPDKSEFFCPCHTSAFKLDGERINKVPPRGMDRLEVDQLDTRNPDAEVRVRFLRFRTMTEERIPLA